MKTFYWLVKREFWEHRGAFLWTPVITTGVVLVLNILLMIATGVMGGDNTEQIWGKMAHANPDDFKKMGAFLDFAALMPLAIINLVLFFVLFSYCMKTLSNDRVDRSILFWKSLPVSDLATVGSKAFSAIVVAPVIATVMGMIGAFGMLFIYAVNAAFHGISFGSVLWGMPHTGHLLAAIPATLPLYMAWMLPCVGWLMMCSAWAAGGKIARWAVALPVGVGAIISWLGLMGVLSSNSIGWFWSRIVVHGVLGVFPGSWVGPLIRLPASEQLHGFQLLADGDSKQQAHAFASNLLDSVGWQYHLFTTAEVWVGAALGIAMLATAIWLRRWRTEY